ncbi:CDP-diacylglycerol--serine O-phosphatidyltransferase [Cellulosilyticum sp. I15G10I2]|uniref:CDP-diacylglycerol--serine O-phosphatidyltransferase n=1 Tax=Cellulosilyticum sp. I15G10I2 TaxID=1892843 RepID=UPI00085C2B8C|nr:CDP-diacylglycerol--serine O-phosphatidyltransferase [Cellulosilyticum sp. I15G10I2]
MKNMRKIKNNIPNLITLVNLTLGVIAILMSVSGTYGYYSLPASFVILAASIADRFDGSLARKMNATSELGKQLDSLSDMVSFGIAPAIIAWKLNFFQLGFVGYLIILVFPIAGAYRLARYNITTVDDFYRGLPIPIAAVLLTMFNIYYHFEIMSNRHTIIHSIVVAVVIILLSLLMVSKFRLKKI